MFSELFHLELDLPTKHRIYPVILCGGSGTRLWPVSRRSYPKQFVPFTDDESLFQMTLRRLESGFEAPILLTGNDFRFTVAEQAQQTGIDQATILIEPVARNTAPAILAAALLISETDPDGIMVVLPSDHMHHDVSKFHAALSNGIAAAAEGHVVTFGITPTRPETGFGYIELAKAPSEVAQDFVRFVEKPDEERAREMLSSGRFLWNSGSFCFSAKTMIAAFETHCPEMVPVVRRALDDRVSDLDFTRLASVYEESQDISFDYAIMEQISDGKVVPMASGWNDLGSWRTIWQESRPDEAGVARKGHAWAIDCQETLLRSDDPDTAMVGIGLRNIVAVATGDAVLVADMDRSQEVRDAVALLRDGGFKQAEEFAKCYRPWGWYETLALGERFQVKRIMVKPGAKLSLQSHVHRAEHWVVVSGAARVTVDDDVKLLGENQSTYIPLGAVHRLENPGKVDLHLIEVQSGAYLGEDDIVRYEDIYART